VGPVKAVLQRQSLALAPRTSRSRISWADVTGHARGDRTDMGASDFQSWLTQLSAPEQLIRWARPFADLEACWRACPAPDWLLWLAARLSRTAEQRLAVVRCATQLARLAQRGQRIADHRVEQAISAAERWAGPGSSPAELLAAADAALSAARQAEVRATAQAAQARLLFRAAPRGRLASARTSRALAAYQVWRAADQQRLRALAAGWTAQAAAFADAASASPESWADCVSQVATQSVSAMACRQPAGGQARAARHCVRLAKRRLSCPAAE
jgi:hypothetical protein